MIRTRTAAAVGLVAVSSLLLAACGGGSGFDDTEGGGGDETASGPAALEVLIGSSGPAETDAVTAAAEAWAMTLAFFQEKLG